VIRAIGLMPSFRRLLRRTRRSNPPRRPSLILRPLYVRAVTVPAGSNAGPATCAKSRPSSWSAAHALVLWTFVDGCHSCLDLDDGGDLARELARGLAPRPRRAAGLSAGELVLHARA